MPASLSYTAGPDIMQDTNVMLIGIFYKVGIQTRDGNRLKFQLKGLAQGTVKLQNLQRGSS